MKKTIMTLCLIMSIMMVSTACASKDREIAQFDYPIDATLYPEVDTGKVLVEDFSIGIGETQKRMDISNIPSGSIISSAKYCMKHMGDYYPSIWNVSRVARQDWNPITTTPQEYMDMQPEDSYGAVTWQEGVWTCIDVRIILQHAVYLDHDWFNFRMNELGSQVTSFSVADFWSPYMKVGPKTYLSNGGTCGEDVELPKLEVRVFRMKLHLIREDVTSNILG